MLYNSVLQGRAVVRVALGGVLTTQQDVEALWERVHAVSSDLDCK